MNNNAQRVDVGSPSSGSQSGSMGKMASYRADNGMVHYGSGMAGSICAVFDPKRRELSHRAGVTCKDCLKILRGRP